MTGSWSAAELPHRVSQKFVEATLRRHAQCWPGNDVRYGWVLEDSKDTDRGIEARVRPTDGGESVVVKACFLVGADGARSTARQRLGIEWGGVDPGAVAATALRLSRQGRSAWTFELEVRPFNEKW